MLDKLTYAGRRENLDRPSGASSWSSPESRTQTPCATRSPASTPSSTSPPRRTSTARSPSPTLSSARTRSAPWVLLEAVRAAGVRYVQVSTDEVYGSIEQGSFTESSPLQPSSPYSATKAGADLLVSSYFHTYAAETVICRGSNNYGPVSVPREADPADGPQCAARRPAARLRRWAPSSQLDLRRGLLHAASAMSSRMARPARRTTSAAPTRRPTSRSSGASSS